MDAKKLIAKRVALEFVDGDLVNLGIGIPTMVANYLPMGIQIILHSENGFVGLGRAASNDEVVPSIINAGGVHATLVQGASFFDSAVSFGIIRGGHLAATVLGALEVDQEGDLANWMVPGKMVPGMGGAMDLVSGAKKVIVAMEHTARNGTPKILKKCTLPLTGRGVVNLIITNLCVFEVTKNGLVLQELAPEVTVEEVREKTAADFAVGLALRTMAIV